MNKLTVCLLVLGVSAQAAEVKINPLTAADASGLMSNQIQKRLQEKRSEANADVGQVSHFYALTSSFRVDELKNCTPVEGRRDQNCDVSFSYSLSMSSDGARITGQDRVLFQVESADVLANSYAQHWKTDWDAMSLFKKQTR